MWTWRELIPFGWALGFLAMWGVSVDYLKKMCPLLNLTRKSLKFFRPSIFDIKYWEVKDIFECCDTSKKVSSSNIFMIFDLFFLSFSAQFFPTLHHATLNRKRQSIHLAFPPYIPPERSKSSGWKRCCSLKDDIEQKKMSSIFPWL